MNTVIDRMVAQARKGENPFVVCKVHSGWVTLGESQVTHGYCLLLPDPVVPTLNALEAAGRNTFLNEMSVIGDALLKLTGAVRINYAIFGNLEPSLHAHVIPRFSDEPEEFRTQHPWAYDWSNVPRADTEKMRSFSEELKTEILKRTGSLPS